MPQAIVDPGELRRFAKNLKKFNSDVQDRIAMLGAQLDALGRTWRDQENKKFVQEFEQHIRSIARFVEEWVEPFTWGEAEVWTRLPGHGTEVGRKGLHVDDLVTAYVEWQGEDVADISQSARTAFLIALAEDPPWAMIQTPFTPRRGAPPYSE